ncbi:unnamed protein product [Heterobilharzia americana]|nr:unnamed protein product [Heterobilharzia americana]
MAVPFSNTTLRVPHGFPNLLEGLAREVLRHQPKDIYGFGAKYFEELLRKREETGIDDLAQLGAKLDDRYYNNKAYCTGACSANNAEHQQAAVRIQAEYRRHLATQETEHLRQENAATLIQSNFRGYRDRKLVKSLKENNDRSDQSEDQAQENKENLEVSEFSDQTNTLLESSNQSTNHLTAQQSDLPKSLKEQEYNNTEEAAITQSNNRGYTQRKREKSIRKLERVLSIHQNNGEDQVVSEEDSETDRPTDSSSHNLESESISAESTRVGSHKKHSSVESSYIKSPEERNNQTNPTEEETNINTVDSNQEAILISPLEEKVDLEEQRLDDLVEGSNKLPTENINLSRNTESEDEASDKTPREDDDGDGKKLKTSELFTDIQKL